MTRSRDAKHLADVTSLDEHRRGRPADLSSIATRPTPTDEREERLTSHALSVMRSLEKEVGTRALYIACEMLRDPETDHMARVRTAVPEVAEAARRLLELIGMHEPPPPELPRAEPFEPKMT